MRHELLCRVVQIFWHSEPFTTINRGNQLAIRTYGVLCIFCVQNQPNDPIIASHMELLEYTYIALQSDLL